MQHNKTKTLNHNIPLYSASSPLSLIKHAGVSLFSINIIENLSMKNHGAPGILNIFFKFSHWVFVVT